MDEERISERKQGLHTCNPTIILCLLLLLVLVCCYCCLLGVISYCCLSQRTTAFFLACIKVNAYVRNVYACVCVVLFLFDICASNAHTKQKEPIALNTL